MSQIHLTPLAECACGTAYSAAADKRAPIICRPHLEELRAQLLADPEVHALAFRMMEQYRASGGKWRR